MTVFCKADGGPHKKSRTAFDKDRGRGYIITAGENVEAEPFGQIPLSRQGSEETQGQTL